MARRKLNLYEMGVMKAPENSGLKIGDEVRDREHPKHVAKIEAFDPKRGIYCRWHKGYASWLPAERVVLAGEIGFGNVRDSIGDPKREPPKKST